MNKRISLFFAYGLFWLIYFLFVKAFFLFFNWNQILNVSLLDIFKVFGHGFSMDLSTSSILLVFPGLLLFFSFFLNSRIFARILHVYTLLLLVLITLLVVGDAELYDYWGFRIDIVAITYLKTPREAFASVSWWVIVRQLLIGVIIFGAFAYGYRKTIVKMAGFPKVHPAFSIGMLILIASLIIPIRGGFGIAPMNTGRAYFSNNNFLNHAGINVLWNMGFSISERKNIHEQYSYFEPEQARKLSEPLLNQNLPADSIVLNTPRPNVIILMLESFSAKVIEPLGGLPGITPNIDKLCNEGLLFTNFYANGDRSDKGIISILCGYPAQPVTSIIVYSHKTESLPKLFLSMKEIGYHTSFYYGGDINFANIRSYLLASKLDNIISKDNFPVSTFNSKWGAHDHIVLKRFYEDIWSTQKPFFNVLFTLSSHEPFEVPGKAIPGADHDSKMLNAIHYTDSCVGEFIAKAKTQPWWQNTIVILLADHGHRSPGNTLNHAPEKFKIPMLWLGGALKSKGRIDKYASQMDIASTLLHQMNLKSDKYNYSKDIFSKQAGFVFYCYDNGFGYLKENKTLVYDCGFKKVLKSKGSVSEQDKEVGKAYLQNLYIDFSKR